jgi:hypothetical protein
MRPLGTAHRSPLSAPWLSFSQLDFELEFFGSLLDRMPDFVEALRVHAGNLAAKGRHIEGLDADLRVSELEPDDALARYNLACSYALVEKFESALDSLAAALLLGYRDLDAIRTDPDFDQLRDDPRFEELLAGYAAV